MNKNNMSLNKFFLSLIKPYRWYVIGLLLTAAYWGINNALAPYVLKLIIDKVAAFSGDKSAILNAIKPNVILYIALWVLIAVDMRLSDWLRLKLFPYIRYDLVNHMFAYLNQHSHRFFQNNFAGSLSNKISDMTAGTIAIFTTIDDAAAQIVGLIIAIISLLLVQPIFALILLIWAIAFLGVAIVYFKPVQDLSNFFATSKTTLVGKIVDSISNITNLRLFSRAAFENQVIRNATQDTTDKDQTMQWSILKMRAYWDISIIVLIAANLYMLVVMYSKGQVSIGDFSFVISLSISIFYNLWYLASQFVHFAEELGKCRQALTLISEPHEIMDKPNAQPLVVTQGRIEFKNVSFHYDEGAHLFKNKSVVIEPGQKIGLVGLSGSGKSTFVNLILRLFDVESGQILIDGKNIRDVTQESLRENIAMIPQDVTLFHRTLIENIRYGHIDATDAEVIAASKKAHCHEFISRLPEKYNALVGERGIKLSGGQRQRIAIARALLKNAPILILDEATSALDSLTEKLIQDGLHVLMQSRTTIVVAHRLSTLSEMDRILVFEKGRIIEDGSHEELIKIQSHYSRMWKMQAGGFLPEKM
ncbi:MULTISPECIES: ABC transporter ATP-binding protein [Legionella]|mgnify:CR=1 FL=1|uniref:ABC transporter ATP-binding protein n=1 Tax=Legionella steelei TaxID=947033 RepID=A0A0W0ZQI9_9GAMM|nr:MULTISPECIES: ABC transporter ATP-binding protein [Legionella]KTD71152.1 ABC transporter ATP-binding protein [Legionella steelei]MBN9225810.1 ABC transporter ATP-binding protein [Legionella steelei]OJW07789.1 MAG: multidrug ABC transporter [Legionella sp. 39-23]